MCGIIGITTATDHAGRGSDVRRGDGGGSHRVLEVLLEGLALLEYRGYDSGGLAPVGPGAGDGGWGGRGPHRVLQALREGLALLEYRGYDSAGLALVGRGAGDGMWRARAANGTR